MMMADGFKAFLETTDDRKPLSDYMTVLLGTQAYMAELESKIESMQDDVNLWQCMKEAGIDNVEAYSQGYHIYYERYPEKDEFA